jgi:hypothetical protein
MSDLEKYFHDNGIDIDAELENHKPLDDSSFDDGYDDSNDEIDSDNTDNEIDSENGFDMYGRNTYDDDDIENENDNDIVDGGDDIVGGEKEGDIVPFDDHEHAKEVIKHFLGKIRDDLSELMDYLDFSDYSQHLAGEDFNKYKERANKVHDLIMNFLSD